MVYKVEVTDLMIIQKESCCDEIQFNLEGEPGVQNGWKLAWKGLPFPKIYDPESRNKRVLKNKLAAALLEYGVTSLPAIPSKKDLFIEVVYKYSDGRRNKDLDNMTKFLCDALEGIVYVDDKLIVKMVLKKGRNTACPSTSVKISAYT